jgi:hypothetical protein
VILVLADGYSGGSKSHSTSIFGASLPIIVLGTNTHTRSTIRWLMLCKLARVSFLIGTGALSMLICDDSSGPTQAVRGDASLRPRRPYVSAVFVIFMAAPIFHNHALLVSCCFHGHVLIGRRCTLRCNCSRRPGEVVESKHSGTVTVFKAYLNAR